MDVEDRRRSLACPLSAGYYDASALGDLATEFRSQGYVRLPELLSGQTLELLRGEMVGLQPLAHEREFVMPGPNTPRVMSVLGGTQLLSQSALLGCLYWHFDLMSLVGAIAGEQIFTCPHPEEFMVCNLLLASGSTHGWHLDDPSYALVLVLEAPERGVGGELEYIPDWREACSGLGLDADEQTGTAAEAARDAGMLRAAHHASGDAYLLRADRCLHRVTPLQRPGVARIVVNFAYERTRSPVHGDSATVLYGAAGP